MGVDRETVIRFGTYIIRNRRDGVLELDMRGVAHSNFDLGIFQKTKVVDGIYSRMLSGYRIFAANSLSRNWGGGHIILGGPPFPIRGSAASWA